MTNKHGIPIVPPPPVDRPCVNRRSGAPKKRFGTRFAAERYVAESINPPSRRDAYRVYACGDHFHLTTTPERNSL